MTSNGRIGPEAVEDAEDYELLKRSWKAIVAEEDLELNKDKITKVVPEISCRIKTSTDIFFCEVTLTLRHVYQIADFLNMLRPNFVPCL